MPLARRAARLGEQLRDAVPHAAAPARRDAAGERRPASSSASRSVFELDAAGAARCPSRAPRRRAVRKRDEVLVALPQVPRTRSTGSWTRSTSCACHEPRGARERAGATIPLALALRSRDLGVASARAADLTEATIPAPVGFVNDRRRRDGPSRRGRSSNPSSTRSRRRPAPSSRCWSCRPRRRSTPTEYKVRVFEPVADREEGRGQRACYAGRDRRARGALRDRLRTRGHAARRPRVARSSATRWRRSFRAGDYAGGITRRRARVRRRGIAAEKGVTLEWNGESCATRRRRAPAAPHRSAAGARSVIVIVVIVAGAA